MSRVRTGIKPGEWRDDGPCPEVSRNRGRNDPWIAEPIGDMIPLIAGTVLSSYSNGHHGPPQPFRIKPVCDFLMPLAKTRCALSRGHKDTHRGLDAVTARQERFKRRAA